MPRPRLHKTPQEKQCAARASRAKYYQLHRHEINARARSKRLEASVELSHNKRLHVSPHSEFTDVEQALAKLVGKSLYSLMDKLCIAYINTRCYSQINAIHTAVSEVEVALTAIIIANNPDNDDDCKVVSGLREHVRVALRVIEDLLLAAMEDLDVRAMRERYHFLYQSHAVM